MQKNIEIKAKLKEGQRMLLIVLIENMAKEAKLLTPESTVDYALITQQTLLHTDTYYQAKEGRLKFREIKDTTTGQESFELIWYDRADAKEAGAKSSQYYRLEFKEKDPALTTAIKNICSKSIGIVKQVEKTRLVYVVQPILKTEEDKKQPTLQARIHIDQVKDKGEFMEIEVILPQLTGTVETETVHALNAHGQNLMNRLIRDLHLDAQDFLTGSYVDM